MHITPEAQARALADQIAPMLRDGVTQDTGVYQWTYELCLAALTHARAADWTGEKPTQEGWFWYRDFEFGKQVVWIHRLEKDSPLFVEHYGWLADMEDGQFSGPLLPPGQHAQGVKEQTK